MISTHRLFLMFAALGLSACVSGNDTASRGTMPPQSTAASQSTGTQAEPTAIVMVAQYDIEAIRVTVPRSLKVSEANTIKPRADIVWRGDALGDRYAQVESIFVEAMTKGTASMQKGRKVDMEIEVVRFHALTEKTRYSIGGMHEMTFKLTLRDAATGQVLDGPRAVEADIKASGGALAIAEEQAGRTQRVVTVERLAQVIRRELSVQVTDPQVISRALTQPAQISQ